MLTSVAVCEPETQYCEEPVETSAGCFNRGDRSPARAQTKGIAETTEFVFVLPNDQARIGPVVEFLATEATRVAQCQEIEQMRICLALEEALANALYHGNLEINNDDSDSVQLCRHDLAEQRRQQLPFCNRRIRVLATIRRDVAAFVVRDDGRGFDPSRLPDPTEESNLERTSGRGVYLMQNLMDEVTFNEIGNEVTLVRRWSD
jgi:anti-sigma regulatory factor (Ser/Thr protein kinase)